MPWKLLWDNPLVRDTLIVLLFAAVWFGHGVLKYNEGYAEAVTVEQAKVAKAVAEAKAQQLKANQEALEASRAEVEKINRERDDLEALYNEATKEAASDPDRNAHGLSAASVRRINRLRSSPAPAPSGR